MAQDHGGDDVSGNAAGTAQVRLPGHVHVGHVLVLTQEGQVEDDLERLGIGSQDNEVSNTAIERLGSLVRALLHLLVEGGLVAQVDQLLGELVVSLGPRAGLAGVLLSRLGLDLLVGCDNLLHLLLALLACLVHIVN